MNIKKINPVFEDSRGSIWDLLTNEQIHHIGYLKTRKNSVRGKHYHKEQKQYTLVLKGKILVTTKDLKDDKSQIESFELNEMEMILFPPFCYHAIKGLEDSECLVFTSKSREGTRYEEDTYRIADINSFKLSYE